MQNVKSILRVSKLLNSENTQKGIFTSFFFFSQMINCVCVKWLWYGVKVSSREGVLAPQDEWFLSGYTMNLLLM